MLIQIAPQEEGEPALFELSNASQEVQTLKQRQWTVALTAALITITSFLQRPPSLNQAIEHTPEVHITRLGSSDRIGAQRLRISTFNAANSLKGTRNVVQAIAAQHSDITCVQEGNTKIKEGVTDSTDLRYSATDSRRLGNLTLSRFPILSTETVPLPSAKNDPRNILVSTMKIKDKATVVINSHYSSDRNGVPRAVSEDWRTRQAKAETALLKKKEYAGLPVIDCGDKNATPDSPTHKVLTQYFVDSAQALDVHTAVTYPLTDHQIDYILISKGVWEAMSYLTFGKNASGEGASDHFGVTVDMVPALATT